MAVLVVLDFAQALAEVDAVLHTARALLPPEALAQLLAAGARDSTRIAFVNRVHARLAAERPELTVEQIREAAAGVPVSPKVLEAIRLAAQQHGADVKILSDSPALHVDAAVQRHARVLDGSIGEVITNPTREHAENPNRIEVLPFHAEPHGCASCPSNMCKGTLVEQLRRENEYERVLYVGGDGLGDFCSATKLTEVDVMFPRSTRPPGSACELWTAINARPDSVRAKVLPWVTGDDFFDQFSTTLARVPRAVLEPLRTHGKALVAFDFDYSLVNADSDVFFLTAVYPELLAELRAILAASSPTWPSIMDGQLQRVASDKPEITPQMIRDTLARIPALPRMLDAFRLAGTHQDVVLAVISDANTIFIESMLEHNGIATMVDELVANPSSFEERNGRVSLRVRPYHDDQAYPPHGCPLCPVNLCKGRELDRLRQKHGISRVLYVGDGPGDYCPTTRMTSNDIIFARDDEANGESNGLLKRIQGDLQRIHATVVPWHTGEEVFTTVAKVLGCSTV